MRKEGAGLWWNSMASTWKNGIRSLQPSQSLKGLPSAEPICFRFQRQPNVLDTLVFWRLRRCNEKNLSFSHIHFVVSRYISFAIRVREHTLVFID